MKTHCPLFKAVTEFQDSETLNEAWVLSECRCCDGSGPGHDVTRGYNSELVDDCGQCGERQVGSRQNGKRKDVCLFVLSVMIYMPAFMVFKI